LKRWSTERPDLQPVCLCSCTTLEGSQTPSLLTKCSLRNLAV
jgi:hypothetical protein